MNRLLAFMAAAVLALAAHAQSGAPRIAISSLVADTITIKHYEQRTGSNLGTAPKVVDMPAGLLDVELLQAAQAAAARALPGAAVYPLRVAKAGSSGDPAGVVVDGKVLPDNALVAGLRQQGFTQLITVTRHRAPNGVRLADRAIALDQGTLEGAGFYLDPVIRVRHIPTGDYATGVVAPYLYIQLRLIDLATLEIKATETLTASTLASSARGNGGLDAWNALPVDEKIEGLKRLIREEVDQAVSRLLRGS